MYFFRVPLIFHKLIYFEIVEFEFIPAKFVDAIPFPEARDFELGILQILEEYEKPKI